LEIWILLCPNHNKKLVEIENEAMKTMSKGRSVAFIVGSPRSGTTILGEILDKHAQICQWYEPYFVWDRYFRDSQDDKREAQDCSPTIRKEIYKDFSRYGSKMGCQLVVDKSPRNSLKIPFILEIFPQGKFIHILRDGRDVTLSIHKEWNRRQNVIKDAARDNRFNYLEAAKVMRMWLSRQPFLKDKVRAFWFETHGHLLNKSKHLNRLRWDGIVGWGPRFRDWKEIIQKLSILEFNAYQWLSCVENIQKCWPEIPEENRLEIRYEVFITQPEDILTNILQFLNMKGYGEFFHSLPNLKKNNFDKWRKEFSKDQLNEIHPILTPKLLELRYENRANWHQMSYPM
jgi:hypothetical protein